MGNFGMTEIIYAGLIIFVHNLYDSYIQESFPTKNKAINDQK